MVDAALVSGVLFGVEGFRRAPGVMRRTGQVRQEQASVVLSSVKDQISEIRPGFGFRIPKSSLRQVDGDKARKKKKKHTQSS